jgi:hypothetical protein
MGNIISNCCSNSLIFSTKNYFCAQQKLPIHESYFLQDLVNQILHLGGGIMYELILQEEKFFAV